MPSSFLEFVKGLEGLGNVGTLSTAELEAKARPFGRVTVDESLSFSSNVRNRSARVSVVLGSDRVRDRILTERQKAIVEKLDSTLEQVRAYLQRAPLICVKRVIGDNDTFNPKCTLYLSAQRPDNIRQAYLWTKTLREYTPQVPGPDLYQVCIPEWQESERQVLIFPEEGLTVILGSDYVGEVKMGFLRMAMREAKQEGMLSLHAGAKLVKARQRDGQVKHYGMLFFGLSGTGKTTHSCHDHGFSNDGEGIEILQDDIVFLRKDGGALGTERGFYLKTEGVRPGPQPVVFKALSGPDTLLENVMVDSDGRIDFNDLTLGGNGRAVIPRESMRPNAGDRIDLPPLSESDGLIIAFITRRMTVLPMVSKLNPEQAAATFMLGESVETSAGDPRRAGESVRVVGTNPFLVGSESDEGTWFYEFLLSHKEKVQCYLLNTGGVGKIRERDAQGRSVVKQGVTRVAIDEMAALIRGIVKGSIDWEPDPYFGTQVPARVDGLDLEKFGLSNFYSQDRIGEYVSRLREERREWLGRFPVLREEIVNAFS